MWCVWGLIYSKCAFAFSGSNFKTKSFQVRKEGRNDHFGSANSIIFHFKKKKKSKLIICITICCDLQIDISVFKFHKVCILENTVLSSGATLLNCFSRCLWQKRKQNKKKRVRRKKIKPNDLSHITFSNKT